MSANTLTVRGFINKIDCVPAQTENDSNKYFAKVAYSMGEGDNRQTQYLSCFVSKSLHRLAQAAFETQTEETDGKTINVLGSQFAEITIVNPYFEINDGGYLNGSGILTSVSFITPELKPNTAK